MAFLAGSKLTASALNAAVPLGDSFNYAAALVTPAVSATYIDSTVLSLAFVTPASGKIRVTISGSVENTSGNSFMSYRISGAAGTVAANDDWAITSDSTSTLTTERSSTQSSLVAGAAGTITLQFKHAAGTMDCRYRYIQWSPVAM